MQSFLVEMLHPLGDGQVVRQHHRGFIASPAHGTNNDNARSSSYYPRRSPSSTEKFCERACDF
jgi:hypothetical protein